MCPIKLATPILFDMSTRVAGSIGADAGVEPGAHARCQLKFLVGQPEAHSWRAVSFYKKPGLRINGD